jgi:uncharacterized protein (DUF2249 family)
MTKKTEKKRTANPPVERPVSNLVSKSMRVKLTFTKPLLGTSPGNDELYADFIAKKSADKEKAKQELASLPAEELEERGKTVFHRIGHGFDEEDFTITADGDPMLYDYQIKGFLKEKFQIFVEYGDIKFGPKIRISKCTVKRHVDNYIFVTPREIPIVLPAGGRVMELTRPLKGETQRGPRNALACSEKVPRGSIIEFSIEWLNPKFEEWIRRALDFGAKKGIGQWRNSGMGRFTWEEVA